jgi:hypothetical protein
MTTTTQTAIQVALIHFVGLTVFTIQDPNTQFATVTINQRSTGAKRFVAIMPRVANGGVPPAPGTLRTASVQGVSNTVSPTRTQLDPAKATGTLQAGGGISANTVQHHVEDHTALIAFRPADLQGVTGWNIQQLDSDFLYVQLTGEQISFVADDPTPAAASALKLSHVGGELTGGYTGPSYPDAAAVFMIPNGTLRACTSITPGVSNSRVDTQLTLSNKGSLTLKSGTKSITFKGDAAIVAANVPLDFAKTHATNNDPNLLPHWEIYCEMTGRTGCPILLSPDPGISDCQFDGTGVKLSHGGNNPTTGAKLGPDIVMSTDFACSNTQWP